MCVALTPDKFCRVQCGDDVEEENGSAFDGLQHQVGDGPYILFCYTAGEVAVVEREGQAMRMRMPQNGISWRIFEMRMRVSDANCAKVVLEPKI